MFARHYPNILVHMCVCVCVCMCVWELDNMLFYLCHRVKWKGWCCCSGRVRQFNKYFSWKALPEIGPFIYLYVLFSKENCDVFMCWWMIDMTVSWLIQPNASSLLAGMMAVPTAGCMHVLCVCMCKVCICGCVCVSVCWITQHIWNLLLEYG